MTSWRGPLQGVRVLDFTRVLAGPYATLLLADQGAEVIKVESVDKGDDTRSFPPMRDGQSHYFIALNRNKKSLALDLKSDKGRKIARDLVAQSDVLVENFRPGVMKRLGLGYEELAAINPKLIYCSISGFGAEGPLADKPSFDIVTQALSGAMSVNGEPGGRPTKLGIPLGDMGGGVYASIAILSALLEARTTGRGRAIDISLLDSLMGMLGYLAQIQLVTGKPPAPVGTKHPNLIPYGAYETSDGYIIIACLTEGFWHNLANAIERSDLIADERFATYSARLKNRIELDSIVDEALSRKPTAEWLKILEEYDVPHAPILDVAEALAQENTIARGMLSKAVHPVLGDIPMIDNPINYVGEARPEMAPPRFLGENSDEVISAMLGMGEDEIKALREEGVIG